MEIGFKTKIFISDLTGIRFGIFFISAFLFFSILYSPNKSFSQGGSVHASEGDYYLNGKTEFDFGRYENALDIWIEGYENLAKQDLTDPRIGPAVIELVTRKNLEDLFEKASEIYIRGFSGRLDKNHYENIRQEITMISPLISEEEYSKWMILLEDGDDGLFTEIRKFWRRNDPIPATFENERLIEHWERIAYARKNFEKAETTIYGTDDRGLIYVKYGLPDKMVKDNFGKLFKYIKGYKALQLAREIQEHPLYYNPEFELWIYDELLIDDTLRFFFGPEGGNGDYGLRYGVEDFIPERAFLESSGRLFRSRQLLGYFLQYYYYYQLENVDDFFYYRMLDTTGRARTASRLNTTRFINADYDKNDPAKLSAPPKSSDYDRDISPVDLRFFVSRYLDDGDNSILRITAYTLPRSHTEADILFHDLSGKHEYGLRHTLTVNNENWFEVNRIEDYPYEAMCNASVFEIPLYDNTNVYQLSSICNDLYMEQSSYSAVPDTLFGVLAGRNEFLTLPEKLSADRTQLELSDLVIGSEMPEALRNDSSGLNILQSDVLSRTSPMMLYIEAYHLFIDPDNRSRYSINYELKREGILGRMDRLLRRSNITNVTSQTNEYSSIGSTGKEMIVFDISSLSTGKYAINIELRDMISGQTANRQAIFTIVN